MAHMKSHNWEAHNRFNADDPGDKTLRYTFPLNENSIVFDCGAYIGDWAARISEKYNCYIHLFEPVPKYAEMCRQRFKYNPKITVNQYGIGALNKIVFMNEQGDGDGSTYKKEGTAVEIVSITDVLFDLKGNNIFPRGIDLIKINIETEEFPLMEAMINRNLQHHFNYILTQFHEWADNAEERHKFIKESIEKSHEVVFDYNFIWECWKKREWPGIGSCGDGSSSTK